MPGRNSFGNYRYGFNGQEKDDEVKGNNNSLNFEFRMYDSRLGKFLSIDPLQFSFPYYSPYHYASNSPIIAKDLEGLESSYRLNYSEGSIEVHNGKVTYQQLQNIGGQGRRWDIAHNQQVQGDPEKGEQVLVSCTDCGYTIGKDVNGNYIKSGASVWIRVSKLQVVRHIEVEKQVEKTKTKIIKGTAPKTVTEGRHTSWMDDYDNGDLDYMITGYRVDRIKEEDGTLTSFDLIIKDKSHDRIKSSIAKWEKKYGVKVNVSYDNTMKADFRFRVNYDVTTTTPGTPDTSVTETVIETVIEKIPVIVEPIEAIPE